MTQYLQQCRRRFRRSSALSCIVMAYAIVPAEHMAVIAAVA